MPEASQVYVDVALTNVSVGYRNAAFIAEQVAPPVAVRKQSGKYFVYDSEREAFRQTDDKRAPGSEANEVNFALSTDSYYAEDHALEAAVSDEERENADPAIQPDIDYTEFLMEKISLNQEIELADTILNNGSLSSTTLSGTDQWSDSTSDPLGAVEAQKATIVESIQAVPNTLVLPYEVYSSVRQHPDVVDRVKYTQGGVSNAEQLAELFDVDRVLVPRAVKNTANPGQTASVDYVWGKNAFLAYVPPRAGLKQTAFAYTFRWALAPGSIDGHLVETWRENRRKADMIRVQKYYDIKVIATGAIYIWKSAVA
jgi:hypothetical protein